MKEFDTITEHQLLFLANAELSRRIDELKAEIVEGKTKQSPRRANALINMYYKQASEITQRMAQINNEYEE